jgi:hypothetical protein
MADDENNTPPARAVWGTPVLSEVHSVEARFAGEGGLSGDVHRHRDLNLDGPAPLSGQAWLKDALDRLKAHPDCPQRVTDAARRLESEMAEAFLRRQCDEKWIAKSIENNLITWGWWPRTRHRTKVQDAS